MTDFRRLAVDYPNLPEIRYELAVTLGVVGRNLEASTILETLVAEFPDHASAHYALGICHRRLGNVSLATQSLRRYLELSQTGPLSREARRTLANLGSTNIHAKPVTYETDLFSIEYPSSWKVLTGESAHVLLSGTAASKDIEAAFVLPRNPDCNVVISVAPFRFDHLTPEQLTGAIPRVEREHQGRSQNYHRIDASVVNRDGAAGLRFLFTSQRLGASFKQSVTTFVWRGKAITITCSAPEKDYDAVWEEVFALTERIRFAPLNPRPIILYAHELLDDGLNLFGGMSGPDRGLGFHHGQCRLSIGATVLYLAEHKGHVGNDEDNKSAHLLLVNLGFAWEELRKMQGEVRTRFGGLYESLRMDTLDTHERSNFRHLWTVSFLMRHERQRHISNVCQMGEAQTERRKAQFLQALATEISSALNGTGTALIRQTPWYLGGIPHLCISCDHGSLEGLDARLPNVVSAMWRAAQSGGWRELEWKPLEIEWPRVALVNVVRGKALVAACSTISTASLFTASDTFNVHSYHYTAVPIDAESFAGTGFTVWESPVLRAAIALQANVLAFVATHFRFYNLAKLIFDQGLQEADTGRILARFSSELRIVLTAAQRSYADAVHILTSSSSLAKAKWLDELKRLCSLLLFELDEDAAVSLTLETFMSWVEEFQTTSDQFRRLIEEIVSFALDLPLK